MNHVQGGNSQQRGLLGMLLAWRVKEQAEEQPAFKRWFAAKRRLQKGLQEGVPARSLNTWPTQTLEWQLTTLSGPRLRQAPQALLHRLHLLHRLLLLQEGHKAAHAFRLVVHRAGWGCKAAAMIYRATRSQARRRTRQVGSGDRRCARCKQQQRKQGAGSKQAAQGEGRDSSAEKPARLHIAAS
jgi:hypothetical protein